ncbi:MAG: peptidoglycan DD-metalloendopeptidase family protein [Acidobacteria bacterium]|nr:peptidoglycan DD-metalloendopeptidase family protein [Acidobacteriota bacterium]MBI3425654.1 peptidoglycan DD-metalloendopeptidase family protein [Acidobacteriota bacterium]
MARNGGVGLADVLVQRLGGKAAAVAESHSTQRAVETARLLRENNAAERPAVATPVSVGVCLPPATEPAATPTNQAAAQSVAHLPTQTTLRELPAALRGVASPHLAPSAVSAPPAAAANLARNATASAAPVAVALRIPLHGRISSNFGVRHDPLHGGVRRHGGVDIAAPPGTPIAAAAGGTVVFAGRRGGYGNLVEIEHADGQRTRYAHAARLLVQAGDEVKPGQTIATVGSTGRSTGPHLHFEVNKDGAHVDPLQAVAKDSKRSRR